VRRLAVSLASDAESIHSCGGTDRSTPTIVSTRIRAAVRSFRASRPYADSSPRSDVMNSRSTGTSSFGSRNARAAILRATVADRYRRSRARYRGQIAS